MKNLSFRQLRYFEALARHGHFRHAAEACGISQPALSMQIKELEEEVGTKLFDRSARQVRLTSFGEEFAHRIHDILRSIDELGDLARASRDKLVGRLRIGVIPTVTPYLLPAIIGALTRHYQGLDLHVRETKTPTMLKELEEGRLDTAIVALPVSEPALTEAPLFTENFVLVRPASEEGKPAPSARDLREMRLLLLEEGHCFRDQALAFCNITPHGTPARNFLEASTLSTLVQMVDAGLGITLIPEMAVPVEARSAAVSIVRFGDPQPARTIGMVWRKSSPLTPQLLQITEIVRQVAENLRQR